MAKINVKIKDLYPFEDSGVVTKITRRAKQIEKGEAKPIKVLRIDDDLLVVEGNNRVAAVKGLGWTEIDAVEIMKREQEMRPYKDALETAKAKGWKGFENWPVDGGLTERSARYGDTVPSSMQVRRL